jgi:hypothetical protein
MELTERERRWVESQILPRYIAKSILKIIRHDSGGLQLKKGHHRVISSESAAVQRAIELIRKDALCRWISASVSRTTAACWKHGASWFPMPPMSKRPTFEGGYESPSQFSHYTGTQTRCRLTLRRNRTLLWLVYFGHPWPHQPAYRSATLPGQWTKAASTPAPSGCPLDDALFES